MSVGFLAGADGFGILFLGHPDAAVVAERFAHKGELALVFAMHGDAGGVNLGEGEVGQICAFLECLDGGGTVATHSIGAQEECTAIATGGEHHSVGGIAFDFAGDEVAYDDAACASVDDHDVEHLAAVERADGALLDLAVERA